MEIFWDEISGETANGSFSVTVTLYIWLQETQDFCLLCLKPLDHNHPTSPLLAKPPELSEEAKLPASMKFVAANTVGE